LNNNQLNNQMNHNLNNVNNHETNNNIVRSPSLNSPQNRNENIQLKHLNTIRLPSPEKVLKNDNFVFKNSTNSIDKLSFCRENNYYSSKEQLYSPQKIYHNKHIDKKLTLVDLASSDNSEKYSRTIISITLTYFLYYYHR